MLEQINESKKIIDEVIAIANRVDLLRSLYSILETFDNELNAIMKTMLNSEKQEPENVVIYQNLKLHVHMTYRIINYVLENSKNEYHTLSVTPAIDTMIVYSSFIDFPNSL